jgi:uncharacterized protein
VPTRYFMDTSALIARFLTRAMGHRWMQSICDQSTGNSIAIAEITSAELASAFNQLARGGVLRKSRRDQSLALFRQQVAAGHYHLVPATWANIERAAALCDVHPLRGYDAVQLACALAFREDARLLDAGAAAAGTATPGDPTFVTEDQRLSAAAAAEGFAVDSPLSHP